MPQSETTDMYYRLHETRMLVSGRSHEYFDCPSLYSNHFFTQKRSGDLQHLRHKINISLQ